MTPKAKNPVLLGLALAVLAILTVIGKGRLHGLGPESQNGSQGLAIFVGLLVVGVFCAALYYIKKP